MKSDQGMIDLAAMRLAEGYDDEPDVTWLRSQAGENFRVEMPFTEVAEAMSDLGRHSSMTLKVT
ncbi:MAG: hypothetical protein IIC12_05145 [Proteobacteria bacterium]|nr:hypothetical protein [Pseudomonadota bacterium]